jgi:hypothetical protein
VHVHGEKKLGQRRKERIKRGKKRKGRANTKTHLFPLVMTYLLKASSYPETPSDSSNESTDVLKYRAT